MQALRVLRARLLEQQRRAAGEAASAARRSQVTSAERNERVRTYNFQQVGAVRGEGAYWARACSRPPML
jgi:protein subunit release factor A